MHGYEWGFDVDAGPIIAGFRPTANAFAVAGTMKKALMTRLTELGDPDPIATETALTGGAKSKQRFEKKDNNHLISKRLARGKSN